MYDDLQRTIESIRKKDISEDRKALLEVLVDYIRDKRKKGEAVALNFICTHNSRRSQFAQIWAQVAAAYTNIDVNCYSGGVEVTDFNYRAINALLRSGFKIDKLGEHNPIYKIRYDKTAEPIVAFSKLYDDRVNNAREFAAVMTCSDADTNCPYIPGTEKRISIPYEDPKLFDETEEEELRYIERSNQIASEMFYVFDNV